MDCYIIIGILSARIRLHTTNVPKEELMIVEAAMAVSDEDEIEPTSKMTDITIKNERHAHKIIFFCFRRNCIKDFSWKYLIKQNVGSRKFQYQLNSLPVFLIDYPVALARCIGAGDHVPLSACWSGQYKRNTKLNG